MEITFCAEGDNSKAMSEESHEHTFGEGVPARNEREEKKHPAR